MNKKLKIKIFIILFILIIIIKVIQIKFIEDIRINIEKFEELNNTFYQEIYMSENKKFEINVLQKEKILKEINKFSTIENTNIKYIILDKKETIDIDENNKTYKIDKNIITSYSKLKNPPKTIEILNEIKKRIKNGNMFYIFDCFRILYIIPVKYNDIECYKIRTTRELLYVDKNTLYPVYLEYNQKISNKDKEKIKIEYVFKENTVTDEDIKIPDLNDYKLIEN